MNATIAHESKAAATVVLQLVADDELQAQPAETPEVEIAVISEHRTETTVEAKTQDDSGRLPDSDPPTPVATNVESQPEPQSAPPSDPTTRNVRIDIWFPRNATLEQFRKILEKWEIVLWWRDENGQWHCKDASMPPLVPSGFRGQVHPPREEFDVALIGDVTITELTYDFRKRVAARIRALADSKPELETVDVTITLTGIRLGR